MSLFSNPSVLFYISENQRRLKALDMTWQEMLSRGLTSLIAFIRGSQQDTLTLYC